MFTHLCGESRRCNSTRVSRAGEAIRAALMPGGAARGPPANLSVSRQTVVVVLRTLHFRTSVRYQLKQCTSAALLRYANRSHATVHKG